VKPTGLPKKQRPHNIVSVQHDPTTNDLHVTFLNGQTYVYNNVDPNLYTGMMQSRSMGKFFHANIKNKHNYHKTEKFPTNILLNKKLAKK
jgi:KTSC domain-containing protein